MSYKDYYYYASVDSSAEPLGHCNAGTMGIATIHFSSMKQMDMSDFLKIYSIKEKDESK
jgi:hypothetical protein